MAISAGIDVGSGAVKVVVMQDDDSGHETPLAQLSARIRRREIAKVAAEVFQAAVDASGVDEIHYVATTGEGEDFPSATGHF